jgi:hypothetical protein
MGCIRIWCRICFYQNDDEEMNMNESLIIFTPEKLLEWLEDDSCPIGTRGEVASQLRVRLSELQNYWDINHTDRRCTVCHGRGETVEFLGMMDDLMYPMMKTEECENCLGKGTVKV